MQLNTVEQRMEVQSRWLCAVVTSDTDVRRYVDIRVLQEHV